MESLVVASVNVRRSGDKARITKPKRAYDRGCARGLDDDTTACFDGLLRVELVVEAQKRMQKALPEASVSAET